MSEIEKIDRDIASTKADLKDREKELARLRENLKSAKGSFEVANDSFKKQVNAASADFNKQVNAAAKVPVSRTASLIKCLPPLHRRMRDRRSQVPIATRTGGSIALMIS